MLLLLTSLLAATPLTPTTVDVIGDVRDAWRRPVHVDAVEAAITTGTLDELAWTPSAADENGAITIPDDGWARVVFEHDEATPALLRVNAVGDTWINGLPRGGDIYNNGAEFPFMLQPGTNEVLLRRGRGAPAPVVTLAADLRTAGASRTVRLAPFDRTLPDGLVDEPVDAWAGVIVQNIDALSLAGGSIEATIDGHTTSTPLPVIPSLAFLKVPVQLQAPAAQARGPRQVDLVVKDHTGAVLARDSFDLQTKERNDQYRRTFRSAIDGSVQYWAMREALPSDHTPGIVLSLHGASVEATNQANCFANRDWCHVIAPTNRRPFGFDWEDWGRIDAMEVLQQARDRYDNEPTRTWLTGHSMGGHGTWNVGLTLPDQWAAIAPSAGWATFWSYTGPDRYPADDGVNEILRRAANPSDTMLMLPNASRFGVYVLHGDADKVVPVREARHMRTALAEFHGDFAYFEEPKAGHWWGDRCMDFPALMDFLRARTRGMGGHRDRLTFITVDPSASSTCDWASITQQLRSLVPSRIDLQVEQTESGVQVSGTTQNVAALTLDPAHDDVQAGDVLIVALDGQPPFDAPGTNRVHLRKDDTGTWRSSGPPSPATKNPVRAGRLRSAWNHGVTLVYGTQGTQAERVWSWARARQDAERWWYRGNGLVEVVADVAFDPWADPDRGVIIYGNRDINGAWATLLADSPIQVNSIAVMAGDTTLRGDDLAAVVVRPRPGSDIASVAAIAGTGYAGQRLTATLPLFLAGVGWPDWMVLRDDVLEQGESAIEGAGFFGADWSLDGEQSRWR